MKEKSKEKFSIELTTTGACSFRCDYCFENKYPYDDESISPWNIVTYKINDVINSIERITQSEWYKNKFDKTQITFWGGEPSLNMNVILKVVNHFPNFSFYIYTNGSNINKLLPLLLISDFKVQLSYDGNPIHDMRRKLKSGEPTSSIVLGAMDILTKYNIPFSLKATISHKDFKYFSQTWDDFYNLYEKYGENINYSVTTDYHNLEIYKYKEDLERNLVDIAAKEYNFYKKHKRFLSNIFSGNKRFCSAGRNMLTIDTNGKVYFCHGCIYSKNNKDFNFGNIFDENLINKIEDNYNFFEDHQQNNETCNNCVSLTCLRCNVKKFENSRLIDKFSKWHDYTNQEELCEYYKISGRIGRALFKLIRGD